MQKILEKIKTNPFLAVLMAIVSVVLTLASFNSAIRKLWQDFAPTHRIAINGQWRAEVVYDWPNARYIEQFNFSGTGQHLQGSASFLLVPRGLVEGQVEGKSLNWITRLQTSTGSEMQQNYRARWQAGATPQQDQLQVTLQIQDATSAHVPIEFVAKRADSE